VTVPEFLAALADGWGARLAVREGRLRFHGPRTLLDSPGFREMLREHGSALVEFLERDRFEAGELTALGFAGEPGDAGWRKVTMLGPDEWGEGFALGP